MPFAVGMRVEVDFDDEGWFAGVVDSAQLSPTRSGAGVWVYSVRLDDGETADDVEGSEIRAEVVGRALPPPGAAERRAGGSSESAGSNSRRGYANTRDDALSEFELPPSEAAGSEGGSEGSAHARVTVAVTSSGVEWSMLPETELAWSPPTMALLKAHDPAHASDKHWF